MEGSVLFNDALNTFSYMVKDHTDSERKSAAATWSTLSEQQGFFYMHHPTDRVTHTTAFVIPVM